jgi:hypothetical protein
MTRRAATERDLDLLAAAVARLRAGVMALVFAFFGGVGLFVATVWLLVRGGRNVGEHLKLLGNYFPGYSVSWPGSVIGLVYGALTGAVVGASLAWIYNRLAHWRSQREHRERVARGGDGGARGPAA